MSTVESIEGGQYDGLSDGELVEMALASEEASELTLELACRLARANEEIDALIRRQREHTCDA